MIFLPVRSESNIHSSWLRRGILLGFHALFLSVGCLNAYGQEQNQLVIENAWINETPPNAKVAAGYLLIDNRSSRKVELVEITSPSYEKIEIHRSVMRNNTAKMQKQTLIAIDARQSFQFKPGEYHLMLYDPVKSFKQGDSVNLVFYFSDETTVTVVAEIRRLATQHIHH